MQSNPALQVSPGLQICPLPPVSVQVCAVVSHPSPLRQSVEAAHCTQLPAMHTGVVGGHCALLAQPVVLTQVLLESQICPPLQSVELMHCTQAGKGLTRQRGFAAGQSCAWVATVHTGLHASLTQL